VRYRFPHGFRDVDVNALSPALVEQIKISVSLCYGFAFSMISLGGFGSLVAFVIGLRARAKIKSSKNQLAGLRMAWWCIIVGALQGITVPLAIISEVLHWKWHT
jgi:hypothetical protein